MHTNPETHRPWMRGLAAGMGLLCAALMLPAEVASASGSEGFIYGKVTTRSGTEYQGRLRWDEEAAWSEHLNASKTELPYMEDAPRRTRGRRPVKVMGVTVGWSGSSGGGRQLVARFGDIDRIEPRSKGRATLVMKGGEELEASSSGGDIGGDITVWDDALGSIKLDWREIEVIQFLPTPADLEVMEHRLYGTLVTEEGTFEGFVQWDQDENLSNDALDGDTRDGSLSIPMGKIRSIEKRGRSSSRVTLEDGRELVLDDSNDVDDDNRGIFIEDPSFGRVLVGWDAFERLDLSSAPDSGMSYGDFPAARPLRGTVLTEDGRRLSGEIAYDLDETHSWELLNGNLGDLEYNIPFSLVAKVEPKDRDSSEVTLKDGTRLRLEDVADVDEDNAGIAVIEGREVTYVPWDEVRSIEFD